MLMPNINQSFKWFWIVGLVIWSATVLFLLWLLPQAGSYAQASFNSRRLVYVAIFGVFWAIAPAVIQQVQLRRLAKPRT
jgi:hypothetical protein